LRQFGIIPRRFLIIVVVQKNDIQIRGVTEFLAAQLAVGNHGKTRHIAMAWQWSATPPVSLLQPEYRPARKARRPVVRR
jgi:hypothetical protein